MEGKILIREYVDIEDYIDEIDDSDLVEEILKRASDDGIHVMTFIKKRNLNYPGQAPKNKLEEVALTLGFNVFATKEEIINEINNLQ